MEKILFIAPHLSTGGLPQYLLKKIQLLKGRFEIFCVEFEDITGGNFVVQKSKLQEILDKKHFITLGSNKNHLITLINSIKPDYIHIEEIVEHFLLSDHKEIVDKIFNPTRKYKIFETSHDSGFNPDTMIIYLPDAFLFVSQWQINQYKNIDVPKYLVEYPIEYRTRPDRNKGLEKLGLDPNKKHILNIGLFTPRKNQAEIFAIASQMTNTDVVFHFVGNQAGNFADYWKPLLDNKPDNCHVWGERSDTESFYGCMDLFLFTSRGYDGDKETMPLVLREALGWQIPIFMYNLDVYINYFDKFDNITYLTGDIEKDIQNIHSHLNGIKAEKTLFLPKPMIKDDVVSNDVSATYNPLDGKFTISIIGLQKERYGEPMKISLVDSYNGITNHVFDVIYGPGVNVWLTTNGGENNFNGYRIKVYCVDGTELYSKVVATFDRATKIIPRVGGVEIMMNHNKYDHSAWWSFYEVFIRKEYQGIKHGDVVVDIGANIGYFSLFALNEGASKVYSIEPSEENYTNLKANLSQFGDKVTTIHRAINHDDSDVVLYINDMSSIHTIFGGNENVAGNSKTITMPGATISSIIDSNNIAHIDFLKIDCEGAEYFLFDNISEEYLKNHINRIFCEVHGFAGSQYDYETKIKAKLIRCGFEVSENDSLNLNAVIIMQAVKKPKIKIVHALNDVTAVRESESIKSLTNFANATGMEYTQRITDVYKSMPPAENCNRPDAISMEPGDYKLGPGHYGCYMAHRDTILSGFENSDCDAILFNECDSILQYSNREFMEKVYEAYSYCKKYNLAYVSFGKKIVGQSHDNIEDDFFITTRLSEAHCILIPRDKYEYFKQKFESTPWDVSDLWYNDFITEYKKGIFSRPYSLQHRGLSYIDLKYKDGHEIEEQNSTMANTSMDDISIVIQTCDKYDFLWKGWYLSWSQHWCWGLEWPVYFCNEGKALPFNDERITHITSPESSDANGFSTRLKNILSQIKTKYVLYVQDDMWPMEKTDRETMMNALYCMKHYGWDSLKLHERIWFNYTLLKTHHFIGDKRILKYSNDSEYLFTHNAAIWRKDFLTEIMTDNENPWDNEFNGTKRIADMKTAKIYHFDYRWYWQPGVSSNGVLTETGQELMRQLIAREDYRIKFDL